MTVSVEVVERDGTVLTTFDADEGDGDTREKATVTQVARVLNKPGSAALTLPLFHPATLFVEMWVVEIRIYRDSTIIFQGPPVQARVRGGAWEVSCVGILGYLTKTDFGPISVNYLTNPNFTSDLSGWSDEGTTTATHVTGLRILGPGTAQLVETTADQDSYLSQTFTVSTGSIGLVIWFRAWCWIDPTSGFEPALEERGLAAYAVNSAQVFAWEPMNNHTPQGVWTRFETYLSLAPSLTDEPVEVRLYSPKGTVRWGACTATIEESVSSAADGTDATEMMRRIVAYCNTENSLNLLTSTPASGVLVTEAYQFFEMANCFAQLETFPARGLADFDVVLSTRTFTTYAPSKGSDKSGTVTFTVPGEGVISFGHLTDATQTETQVVARFGGYGAARELGVATDAAALDGLILQGTVDVPPEISVDGLAQYAATTLGHRKAPVQIPDFTLPAADVFGVFDVGDTVGVSVDLGRVQMSTAMRVYQLVWDPVGDTVAVGVTA